MPAEQHRLAGGTANWQAGKQTRGGAANCQGKLTSCKKSTSIREVSWRAAASCWQLGPSRPATSSDSRLRQRRQPQLLLCQHLPWLLVLICFLAPSSQRERGEGGELPHCFQAPWPVHLAEMGMLHYRSAAGRQAH